MKCSEVQELIDSGAEVGGDATLHIAECERCSAAGSASGVVTEWFRSLPKAEAPPGFESRVFNDIEARSAAGSVPFFLNRSFLAPAAAVVALAVFVSAYVLLSGGAAGPDTSKAGAANEPAGDTLAKRSPSPRSDQTGTSREEADTNVLSRSQESSGGKTRNSASPAGKPEDGGRSIDFGARGEEPREPSWLDRKPKVKPGNSDRSVSMEPRVFLSMFGIRAVRDEKGWRVVSVAANSIADRAGIRAGDLVMELDGKPLGDAPLKGDSLEGKQLTVLRNGERIIAALKP